MKAWLAVVSPRINDSHMVKRLMEMTSTPRMASAMCAA